MNKQNTAAFLLSDQIINKTVRDAQGKGQRVFSHILATFLPTLESLGLAAPDSISEQEITDSEGTVLGVTRIPVYSDPTLHYTQVALTQRIQGLARSRDEAGHEACESWAAIHSIERTGAGGQYQIILKAFRTEFMAWLAAQEQGFSESQQLTILSLTNHIKLVDKDDATKARFSTVLDSFVDTLDAPDESAMIINLLNKALESDTKDVAF